MAVQFSILQAYWLLDSQWKTISLVPQQTLPCSSSLVLSQMLLELLVVGLLIEVVLLVVVELLVVGLLLEVALLVVVGLLGLLVMALLVVGNC